MNRTQKESEVGSLQNKFLSAKTIIVTDYRSLSVAEITSLRKDLREKGTEYHVVKNTLAKRALEGTKMEPLRTFFTGPSAIALNKDDPVAPARTLSKFIKDNPKVAIKAGFLEGKVISLDEVKELAGLSSRRDLIASLLATLQGPPTGIVSALSGILRKFLGTLEAIRLDKAQ